MNDTKPNYGTALIFLAVIALFLFVQDDDHRAEWGDSDELQAVQQEEQAKASREFAGQYACGPGAQAQWLSDKELQCVPKRGKFYSVAGVQP